MLLQMLEHMVADRQSNVTSLRSMGRDLQIINLDLTQQCELRTMLDKCLARYATVADVCVQHRRELDRIESAISRYRTKLETFLSWLDVTECCAAMTDSVSADVSTVQQQAARQRVSCFCFVTSLCV